MASINLSSFPVPEEVECSKCKASIKLYDPAGSEYCVCGKCNSYLHFLPDNSIVIKGNAPPTEYLQALDIGAEGTLKGHQFRLIAYIEKKERDTVYEWREYILYNHEKGYITLSEFDGHWNYNYGAEWDETIKNISSTTDTAEDGDVEYSIFNKYRVSVKGVRGEFDWDIIHDTPKVHEYIAPPYLLSKEMDSAVNEGVHYYKGEYLEPEEVVQAFGADKNNFPERVGIGANQPSKPFLRYGALKKVTIPAVIAVLVFYLLIYMVKPEQHLMGQDFSIRFKPPSGHSYSSPGGYEFAPFVTPSFKQPNGSTAIEIIVSSQVDNNWMEATVSLVNEQTNESWEVSKGIEYYHGYEGGESWTEGRKKASIILSGIPKGTYHLNVYPVSGDYLQTSLHIDVFANVVMWRNIFITLLLLLAYPAWCYYRMQAFEKNRWLNSDYSIYDTSE